MSSSLLQGFPTLFGAPCFFFFYFKEQSGNRTILKKCLKTSFSFLRCFCVVFPFSATNQRAIIRFIVFYCVVFPTHFWPRRAVSAPARITSFKIARIRRKFNRLGILSRFFTGKVCFLPKIIAGANFLSVLYIVSSHSSDRIKWFIVKLREKSVL